MKKISAEKLDELLFEDREKKKKFNHDGRAQADFQSSLRDFFLTVIDMLPPPRGQREPPLMNRERLANINKVYEALSQGGDCLLEDKQFDFLKQQIDDVGVRLLPVYEKSVGAIDSAEDVKVKESKPEKKK